MSTPPLQIHLCQRCLDKVYQKIKNNLCDTLGRPPLPSVHQERADKTDSIWPLLWAAINGKNGAEFMVDGADGGLLLRSQTESCVRFMELSAPPGIWWLWRDVT